MNFVVLPYCDIYDLACSLRPRAAQFTGDKGVRHLHVRGPRQGAEDPDDDTAYVRSRDAAKWPELTAILNRVEQIGNQSAFAPIVYGRIFFEWLDAGVGLPWRRYETPYFARFWRLHLAVRTNPGALIYSGNEQMQLPPGQLAQMNVLVPHSAINLGDSPRVHLVLDVKRRELEQ